MKRLFYNEKKIFALFIWLILGIALIFYGIFSYVIDMKQFGTHISDEEVIQRAKNLGMVEIKETLKETP